MIRLARSNDVDSMFDVRTSVSENHMSLEELARVGITNETVRAMLAGPSCAWVAESDGEQVVGFCIADSATASVFALFVRPTHQRKGIGRALMAEAEQWLCARGCRIASLVTSGPAEHFYQRLGWTPNDLQSDGQKRFTKSLGTS